MPLTFKPSNVFYDIYKAHWIMDFGYYRGLPYLFRAFLMQIGRVVLILDVLLLVTVFI